MVQEVEIGLTVSSLSLSLNKRHPNSLIMMSKFPVTHPCEEGVFCYKRSVYVESYLNLPHVRDALAIPSLVKNWTLSSDSVFEAFYKTADPGISLVPQIKYLLESEIDVLIYSGTLDLACNTAGSKRWMSNMQWKGQAEWNSKDLKSWGFNPMPAGEAKEVLIKTGGGGVHGKKKGNTKNKDGTIGKELSEEKLTRLALVTVYGSGHMVSSTFIHSFCIHPLFTVLGSI